MHRFRARVLAPFFGVFLAVAGCTPSPDESDAVTDLAQEDSAPVAWVNGSPITEDDVTRSIVKTFGPGAYANLTAETRKTVIDSLVMSRAMAQLAEREIGASDLRGIEAATRSFREQELVKFYLRSHARPQPVTEAMVRRYYEEHPEAFGGGKTRVFEMLAAPAGMPEQVRARAMDAMGAAERREDWAQYADRLRSGGLEVRYSRGELKEALLDERLVAAAKKLAVGEPTPITFVDGAPYVLRIVSEQTLQPRPLQEVRGDIRKALLPSQLKSAIEDISDEVMADVEVRYAAEQGQ